MMNPQISLNFYIAVFQVPPAFAQALSMTPEKKVRPGRDPLGRLDSHWQEFRHLEAAWEHQDSPMAPGSHIIYIDTYIPVR